MAKLPIVSWIGNAAAVLVGGWGAVSRQAQAAGCSRQTAYDHAEKVEAAVRDATGGGPSREQLQQQLRQQAERLAALEKRLALDQVCRGLVVTGCFDEIFFHGNPVLVGVEPHSMAWVLGEHAVDRSGSTWNKALQGFDALEQAVVDGGRGLQRGLADFQSQRKNAENSTTLEVSLDVFHTKQEAQRVLRKLWNRVESQWARAEKADREVTRAWRNGGDRRGFGGAAARAWRKVERGMERYDRVERAWKRIETAFELFRPDGRLNDRAWAEGQIAAAVKELDGAEWGKLRRALADRRSLTFLDRMQRQLTAVEPRAELREALIRRWWLRRQSVAVPADAPGGGRWLAATLVQTEYCRKLAANWRESYRRVAAVLRQTVPRQQCGRVHEQRVADAPGSASDGHAADAGPQAAVLELPSVPKRQASSPLSLRTSGPDPAHHRLVATAAHAPRRFDATSVKFGSYDLRRSQPHRRKFTFAL